jgi:hypothetical protein
MESTQTITERTVKKLRRRIVVPVDLSSENPKELESGVFDLGYRKRSKRRSKSKGPEVTAIIRFPQGIRRRWSEILPRISCEPRKSNIWEPG